MLLIGVPVTDVPNMMAKKVLKVQKLAMEAKAEEVTVAEDVVEAVDVAEDADVDAVAGVSEEIVGTVDHGMLVKDPVERIEVDMTTAMRRTAGQFEATDGDRDAQRNVAQMRVDMMGMIVEMSAVMSVEVVTIAVVMTVETTEGHRGITVPQGIIVPQGMTAHLETTDEVIVVGTAQEMIKMMQKVASHNDNGHADSDQEKTEHQKKKVELLTTARHQLLSRPREH